MAENVDRDSPSDGIVHHVKAFNATRISLKAVQVVLLDLVVLKVGVVVH